MSKEYEVMNALLDKNIYSRPGTKIKGIRGICIHWVGNANSKAINNRNYFNNLKNQTTSKKTYASSHEVIGLNGEVIVCVPKDEVAYHAGGTYYTARAKSLLNGTPNSYLYGIETCHPDWGGKFNDKTYKTLVNRVADLLIEFNITPSKDTLWRHHDVTGKDCPKYYVDRPKEWDRLVDDITQRYKEKVEVLFVAELQKWQKEMGVKSIDSLVNKGIVNNPEDWKKTLGDNVPQWLFWSIINRVTEEGK